MFRRARLTRPQAGLFSAVASAFIIDVQSQLQSDPNDETAALLRVLIYKIDNTTFGNDVPALPQWTGPPHSIVQVQAILFASLATSLFSAFLAMLGKQWLNRYESTDVRGSAVERSQNRQRKLDGIVAWYFDYVMELLPLMLQVALLLLGCALSRYLWEIDLTVASVVLGVTSFGMIFYLSITMAGAARESCPYQTPGARILRHVLLRTPRVLRSIPSAISRFSLFVVYGFAGFIRASYCYQDIVRWSSSFRQPWYSSFNIILPLVLPHRVLVTAAGDVCLLGGVLLRLLASFGRTAYRQLRGMFSSPVQSLDQQTLILDLRCISWMLQTSLDKVVHLSTLKHLETLLPTLTDFHPTLVADCFGAFTGCISVINHRAVVMQGLEQLATVSAVCLLHTFHYLLVTDPASSVLEDVRQHYDRVFPAGTDFKGLPFYHTMAKIHALANQRWIPRGIQWADYQPSPQEHIPVARGLAVAAQVEYRKSQHRKVPRWILSFALHSLFMDPLPSTPVAADCLLIIAVDLGCDVSDTRAATLDERCVRIPQTTITLTLDQCTPGASFEPDNRESQNDGRSRESPYAPIQAQGDQRTPPIRCLAGAGWAT